MSEHEDEYYDDPIPGQRAPPTIIGPLNDIDHQIAEGLPNIRPPELRAQIDRAVAELGISEYEAHGWQFGYPGEYRVPEYLLEIVRARRTGEKPVDSRGWACRNISAAVVLRKWVGDGEIVRVLEEFLIARLGPELVRMHYEYQEGELGPLGARSSAWMRGESLLFVGRAVECIGEEAEHKEERGELRALFGMVLKANLERERRAGQASTA